ncbi:MAG: succinate dehydrogenase cytochrome b subunit [Acidimicrobiia bacterium]|nr:succinate dehydrogenase cytochrome b subunit [Acidimicrobiia bacterium]NNF10079.1 succinate dehydrogenase cytochrome b subunit [Acidimicrobiia bacterium]NNL69321.1 succinate dehydrogenase cytochrome b subunit [Acidimicrobiia bacterium]
MTTTAEAPAKKRSLPWFLEFYNSNVGRKWVMAISGIVGLGFVFFHMFGNLHLYEEPARFDEYAEGLRDFGEPIFSRTLILWIARFGLLAAFAVHVHAGFTLWWKNRKAKPVGYERQQFVEATFASRYMLITGVIVLAFIVYHLAHLTWGLEFLNPSFTRGEARENLIEGLESPITAGWYVVANLALGLHILHGAWSLFQSLGVTHPRFNRWRRNFAVGLTAVIVAGNVSFPIAISTGLVGS